MRIVHLLAALLLVPPLGATAAVAAPDQPTEERSQRVRVSLETSTPWVKKGRMAELSGRVSGVRGRPTVTILQRDAGERGWFVEARKRVSRKGYFRHSEDVRSGSRDYKACVSGRCSSAVRVRMGTPPTPPPPPPPPPPVIQPTSLSLTSISATSVEAGQAFTVAGGASPNLEGHWVQVQAYDAGSSSWGAVGGASVTNGAWSAPTAITTAGRSVPLRAVFSGAAGLQPSTSTAGAVTVYGWYYLYDREEVAGGWYASSFGINGTTYAKSVSLSAYTGDTDYAELDLSRSCTRFAATVGVEQTTSDTGTTYTGRLLADSVTVWSASGIRYTSAIPVDVSITSALRMRLEATNTAGRSNSLVFGDARVLCAF